LFPIFRKTLVLVLVAELCLAPAFSTLALAEPPATLSEDDLLNSVSEDPDAKATSGEGAAVAPVPPQDPAMASIPLVRPELSSSTPPPNPFENTGAHKTIEAAEEDAYSWSVWALGAGALLADRTIRNLKLSGRADAHVHLEQYRRALEKVNADLKPSMDRIAQIEKDIETEVSKLPKRSTQAGHSQSDVRPYYGPEVCKQLLGKIGRGRESVRRTVRDRWTDFRARWTRPGRNSAGGSSTTAPSAEAGGPAERPTANEPAPVPAEPTPTQITGAIRQKNVELESAYKQLSENWKSAAKHLEGLPGANRLPGLKDAQSMQIKTPFSSDPILSHRMMRDSIRDIERYLGNYEKALVKRIEPNGLYDWMASWAGGPRTSKWSAIKGAGFRGLVLLGIHYIGQVERSRVHTAEEAVEALEDKVTHWLQEYHRTEYEFSLDALSTNFVLDQLARQWSEFGAAGRLPRTFEGLEFSWKSGVEANRLFIAQVYRRATQLVKESGVPVGQELWTQLLAHLLQLQEQNQTFSAIEASVRVQYAELVQSLGEELPRYLGGKTEERLSQAVDFEITAWQFAVDTLWSHLEKETQARLEAEAKASEAAAGAGAATAPANVGVAGEAIAQAAAPAILPPKPADFPFLEKPMPLSPLLPGGDVGMQRVLEEARQEAQKNGKDFVEQVWTKIFAAAELSYNADAEAPTTTAEKQRFEKKVYAQYQIWIDRLVKETPDFYREYARDMALELEQLESMRTELQRLREVEKKFELLKAPKDNVQSELPPEVPAPAPLQP
jgi:hypothetical protein